MKRTIFILSLLLSTGLAGFAQTSNNEEPRAELYGGYQYTWADAARNNVNVNLHGFDTALSFNMNQAFGATIDFAGAYTDTETALYTAMAGPRLSFWRSAWFSPFGHALFGAARGYVRGGPSDWSFAMDVGAGLDVNVHRRIGLRLVQADYLFTMLDPNIISADDIQNNFRVGGGLVLRF